jgi:triacylglycerol esterase/lipase EstA (alpha/beta hydrolase family)
MGGMITILRASGLRVVIYQFDHPPPHVHVQGAGEVKIELRPNGKPRILEVRGMKAGDVRKALDAVADNHDMLLQLWSDLHG